MELLDQKLNEHVVLEGNSKWPSVEFAPVHTLGVVIVCTCLSTQYGSNLWAFANLADNYISVVLIWILLWLESKKAFPLLCRCVRVCMYFVVCLWCCVHAGSCWASLSLFTFTFWEEDLWTWTLLIRPANFREPPVSALIQGWNYRHVLLFVTFFYGFWESELSSLYLYGRCFTDWAITPASFFIYLKSLYISFPMNSLFMSCAHLFAVFFILICKDLLIRL